MLPSRRIKNHAARAVIQIGALAVELIGRRKVIASTRILQAWCHLDETIGCVGAAIGEVEGSIRAAEVNEGSPGFCI